MENSETKSKAIDPCCHQLKRKLSDTSSNVNKESKRKKKSQGILDTIKNSQEIST